MTAMVLALALQTTCANPATDYPTYAEAYQEASETGKPLLIMVTATWCGPCKNMKSTILPEVRRRGVLNEFSFGLVDVDRERKLVQQLGGTGPIPQLVCYRQGKGQWYRSKLVGGRGADQVEQFLRAAASRHMGATGKDTKTGTVHKAGRTDSVSEVKTESDTQAVEDTNKIAKK
jgi:thioredoxin-like negative regulator of GroEL